MEQFNTMLPTPPDEYLNLSNGLCTVGPDFIGPVPPPGPEDGKKRLVPKAPTSPVSVSFTVLSACSLAPTEKESLDREEAAATMSLLRRAPTVKNDIPSGAHDHDKYTSALPLDRLEMDKLMECVKQGKTGREVLEPWLQKIVPTTQQWILLPEEQWESKLWRARDSRFVTLADLVNRVKLFLDYYIPGYEDIDGGQHESQYGRDTAETILSCTREPWRSAKLLAWAGRLSEIPNDQILPNILDIVHNGKYNSLFVQPRGMGTARRVAKKSKKSSIKQGPSLPSARMQASTKLARQDMEVEDVETLSHIVETSTTVSKEKFFTGHGREVKDVETRRPIVKASTPVLKEKSPASTAPSGKRKRSDRDGSESKATKKKRGNFGDSDHSDKELFGRHIKETLNARSKNKADYEAFRDAILPPNNKVLDPYDLDPQEVSLCEKLTWSHDIYRCQKARFFLGLAIWVEQNRRAIEEGCSMPVGDVRKSVAQFFGNIDVNKISSMFGYFESRGWIQNILVKDENNEQRVSTDYLRHFPSDHRRELMQEVADFEANPQNGIPPEQRYAKVQPSDESKRLGSMK
ncbi:hypothetical protein EDD36DRAFT_197629 [Exophiala viscosa]|uniref:Uncharacterized protein n=1 Tax=Exophiala viscosa TaxID=2486360 RepID=A0AAN6IF93_9EURO|nr:hypothetical protein EDD36DRAFT_197629 [Exophiala viscosa]